MPPPNTPDDSDDDLMQAMAQSSPARPAPSRGGEKRPHSAVDSDDTHTDGEEPPQTVTVSGTVNQNLTAAVQRYGAKKRLRGEQITELEVFITVSLELIRPYRH